MSVDNQLLNNKNGREESAKRVGDLTERQRGNSEGGSANQTEDEPSSLREQVVEAKRGKAIQDEKEGGAGDKIASAAATPVRQGTSKLLQQAWLNLVDSFGLTLIWIDIHVWLGSIVGDKFFCKLGAEWLDTNIKTAQVDYAKKQGGMIGTVEPMVMYGCNLGCLLILVLAVCLLSVTLGFYKDPVGFILAAFKLIVGTLWDNWFK